MVVVTPLAGGMNRLLLEAEFPNTFLRSKIVVLTGNR